MMTKKVQDTTDKNHLKSMMGIYQNLQILCKQKGSESATFNWREVHSLLETGKHELVET